MHLRVSKSASCGERDLVGLRVTYGKALGAGSCLIVAAICSNARAQQSELQPSEAQPAESAPDAHAVLPADAETPPPASSAKAVEVELAGGVAYVTPPIRGGATPFGAGFGARIGLDVSGFYIGASIVDFLGAKDVDVSYRSLLCGGEFGYGFHARAFAGGVWVLRPRLGVGDAAIYYTDPTLPLKVDVVTSASGVSSTSTSSDTITVNNIFLQPGVTLELASRGHFLAIDGSMLVLPGIAYSGADPTTWISYGAQIQLGFRF
jgi:hypothetical protein